MPAGSVLRSIFDDEPVGPEVLDDSVDDIPRRPVPLMRMNSLAVSKLLVEGTVELDPCVDTEIIFDRDFDNLGVLGSGSFADVYLACRKSSKNSSSSDLPRRFAIKKNRKKFRGRGDREALLNEVYMMKRAGTSYCPYIVHLVRAWQEDRFFYVQMDIAERGSLRDLLVMCSDKSEAIPDDAIYQVAHDTLMGLAHIHAAGVVHFDIKPANLLISKAGRIMIGDFGLAALAGQPSSDNEGDTRYYAAHIYYFQLYLTSNLCVTLCDIPLTDTWHRSCSLFLCRRYPRISSRSV
jgi:serine/threonine protein kinase